ncbi:MAG: type II toxin-antitoxin system MqsA family antitoxin [Clostridia bacterium]|nr:type II toxin-antitoxin system MqsA family antitoxin [Clostridia bacterium]
MICIECGNEMTLKEKTYVANLDTCVIIIKHVPAYVCSCGEVYYTDETFAEIEQLVSNLRNMVNDIAVIDYKSKQDVA